MGKPGRPKMENGNPVQLCVRVSTKVDEMINKVAEEFKVDRADVVRAALETYKPDADDFKEIQ